MDAGRRRAGVEQTRPPRRGIGRFFHLADSSVRARVLVPTAMLFTLTLGLATMLLVRLYDRGLDHEHRDSAELAASVIETNVRHELSEAGPRHLETLLGSWAQQQHLVRSIRILGNDGEVLFASDRASIGQRTWDTIDDAARARGERYTGLTGDGTLAIVSPLRVDETCSGCHPHRAPIAGYLDTRFDPTAFDDHLMTLAGPAIAVLVGALLLLLAIAWWLLTTQVVRPLARLRSAMRVARHVLDVRADESRPDELGDVARSFNHTLDALHDANEQLEVFYRERAQQVERFAAIGELAAGMAHELKNPLAGMSGAIELLAEDLGDNPRQRELARHLRHQLARLTQTMESMLGFARRPNVVLRPVPVNTAIEKTLFIVDNQIRKIGARIAVERDLADELPDSFADPQQLEQALLNIALNAVQAMADRGGTLTARSYARGDRVVVEIADTGTGIPSHVRARIFEPYFTTKDGGTGLGLAMTARIISEHGGSIDYDCPPGGGTVFRISLQTASSPRRHLTETPPPTRTGAAA